MPQPPAIHTIGTPFVELQSVDSTNNYARQQIHAGMAQTGMAVFSHEQIAGKGQRGKVWASQKDVNIALSIVISPQPLLVTQQFQLSACLAVALQQFFMQYAGNATKIKWPNDLYWQDRKAGGILIENIIGSGGNWVWAICGMGININQTTFSPHLPNPVSLKQITGKDFKIVQLAKDLCICLDEKFRDLKNLGFESIYNQYLLHLYKLNEKMKLKKDSRVFEATIRSVSPEGKLVVQHSIEEEFDFGEVEWVF
ncbi:MAG: biotin--[acetyl-CoA-carboxylase] ligase [Chitinophagaceae bacterium]